MGKGEERYNMICSIVLCSRLVDRLVDMSMPMYVGYCYKYVYCVLSVIEVVYS